MPDGWQKVNDSCLSCHSWQESDGRRLNAMTFLLTLLVLSVLASVATVVAVRGGGRGCPPRSHPRDDRFRPPASLVH